jgi:hypothetical protein
MISAALYNCPHPDRASSSAARRRSMSDPGDVHVEVRGDPVRHENDGPREPDRLLKVSLVGRPSTFRAAGSFLSGLPQPFQFGGVWTRSVAPAGAKSVSEHRCHDAILLKRLTEVEKQNDILKEKFKITEEENMGLELHVADVVDDHKIKMDAICLKLRKIRKYAIDKEA